MSDVENVETTPSNGQIWHWLTLVTLGVTALVALGLLILFFFPALSPLRAQPEPTLVAIRPTLTPRPTIAPTDTPQPTWTSPPTATDRPTATPRDTPTPPPVEGPTPTFPPTWTPSPTPGTPPATRSNYPFALQNNEIIFTEYFFSSSCDWLGIAGLVLDDEGEPVVGLPVVLNGGGFQNHVTYSGNAPAYGESGWEHFLDSKVKEGDFSVQLYNNKPEPISDQIHVHTRADCRGNLIWIVFEQNWAEYTP